MLDARRLRVLREVVERGSFSAAAEALAFTQSAVSQQISALEREVGARLLERGSRGVSLTDAGRALMIHADGILGRIADAEAELEAIAGLRGGRLRVTTFSTAGGTIVAKAIAEFRSRYPGVELTLTPREPEEAIATLRAGDAELAVSVEAAGDQLAPPPDFARQALLDDPMMLVLAADHPLATRDRLRLADLAEEEWILGPVGSCPEARIVTRACTEAGFEPRVAFESEDYMAVQGLIASGFGVALIPELALVAVRPDVVVRALEGPPPVRHVFAATLAGAWESPAKQAMLDLLVEVSGDFAVAPARLAGAPLSR